MRHGGWSWSAHRALLVAWVLVLLLGVLSAAHAGRNANGALIVHTNDAVSYTYSGDYCGIDYDAPDSCGAAGTRTDKDEDTPAVIWLLAAFPDTSSPEVTAIQFGIERERAPSLLGVLDSGEVIALRPTAPTRLCSKTKATGVDSARGWSPRAQRRGWPDRPERGAGDGGSESGE